MSSVKKNLTYNMIYQILIIIIPLITTPYISRVIGKDGVGIYSYTYSVAHYFVLFAMLGINNYGNRVVAKYRDDKEKLSKEFSSLYVFQVITSIIMIVLYIFYIKFFDNKYFMYSLIQGLYVLSSLFEINWLFFGLEKFKLTVLRNTIIKIISTICIFIFVKKVEDLGIYVFILSASSLVTQLSLWVFVKREVKFIKPKFKEITKHIKPDLILFVPVIAVSLYKIMDKIMLGNMSSVSQVGLYDSAEKIVSIPLTLISAFGTVMLPRTTNLLSNNNEEKVKKYLEMSIIFVIFISLPIIFGLASISDTLAVVYFGETFRETGAIIKVLSISIVFTGVANVIRTQYLIPKEKDKEYIISVFTGAVVNLIMNLILIPTLYAKGAAIGTICAEISVCILQIFFFKEKSILYKNLKLILNFIVSSVIMYIIINFIGMNIENGIINIGVKVILGVVIYLGINIKFVLNLIGGRKRENKECNV